MGSLVGASDDVKRAGIESSLNDYTVSLGFFTSSGPVFHSQYRSPISFSSPLYSDT